MKNILLLLTLMILASCKDDPVKENVRQKENTIILDTPKKVERNNQEIEITYDKEKLFIKSFYKDYISEIESLEVNSNKVNSILENYCSLELLQKIKSEKELDFDPFIDAQDVPINFLKTLEVKKFEGKENRFVVSYLLGEIKNNIELDLIKKENEFKINNVYTINVISAFDNIID